MRVVLNLRLTKLFDGEHRQEHTLEEDRRRTTPDVLSINFQFDEYGRVVNERLLDCRPFIPHFYL